MLKIERQNLIDQDLRKAGYVLVPELSEKLRCSEETVRRDLREMEIAGKLVRTHGGAYLVEKYDKGYPIELRKSYLQHTKERMAAAAVSIIQENDMVMLDSSTTCLTIAEAILALDLTVTLITNSLAICTSLQTAIPMSTWWGSAVSSAAGRRPSRTRTRWRRCIIFTPTRRSSAARSSARNTDFPTTTSVKPTCAGRCSRARR